LKEGVFLYKKKQSTYFKEELMEKRKSLLSPEQEKLLQKFNTGFSKEDKPLSEYKAKPQSSNNFKPQVRRSGSRGK
jgi:hypothetical protein